jgi:Metallo-beta-lactamase superfamily
MKQLHCKNLFGWSAFNPERNIDFNSLLWVRPEGNVMVDPLPLSLHDANHVVTLGGVDIVVLTNSDHVRSAEAIASQFGAILYGPAAERESFPIACQHWLKDSEVVVPGLVAYQLDGSKTPGELALLLNNNTLIMGDLIRCHVAGELCLLPDAKLKNKDNALASLKKLAALSGITTVWLGDGWPIFHYGGQALQDLADKMALE